MKERTHIRLREHDYGRGTYFVTICVRRRECDLGEVKNGRVLLSAIGEQVEKCWLEIPDHFSSVEIDTHVVMPNHFHGILSLGQGVPPPLLPPVGAGHVPPLRGEEAGEELAFEKRKRSGKGNAFGPQPAGSLAIVIGQVKAAVTRWCRQNGHEYFAWQRGYHDRWVRDPAELPDFRNYIRHNPSNWESDLFHP